MKTVLFACTHNAGRSQMAAAFFDALADPEKARAVSAGTHPAERPHPEVIEVMREAGFDLGSARPRSFSSVPLQFIDLLVTMGCDIDACPVAPGVRREDWNLPDPKGLPLERVREIRDEVESRVRKLLASEGWSRS